MAKDGAGKIEFDFDADKYSLYDLQDMLENETFSQALKVDILCEAVSRLIYLATVTEEFMETVVEESASRLGTSGHN